jgi:glycosyltransferase involved in cell wall biosynthesis
MHALLIHQAFASPREPGGTRHFELARKLVQEGHQFTVVASNLSYLTGQSASSGTAATLEVIEGVRVLRAHIYPALHRNFVWRAVCFLHFMVASVWTSWRAGPVDLVMGTTPPIFQAVSACLVAALRRRPFLLEVRDLWPEFAIGLGILKSRVLISLSRWLERFLYSRATHLVVNSPAYRDYLVAHDVRPERITLLPNGVDPGMFDPALSGEAVRSELGLDHKYVVTYAGALGVANDLETLLEAADRLRDEPDLCFLLVGDGKERTRLEAGVGARRLANVIFAGARPKQAMPAFLAASNACIAILRDIPEFRTTYPNKVFDYMAAGRPTILAIDGVIREVIEAASGGIFVRPGDSKALAEAVLTLRQHPDRAKQMGAAARRYVVKHFDRADQAKEFMELMVRLAAEGRRAHAGR